MKPLKIFKNLLLVLGLFFVISCSSSDDDNPKTKVRYHVVSDYQMITSIMYRDADGDMVEGLEDVTVDWEKTVNVETPFTADFAVSFNNTSSATQNYTLAIYVDDEVVDVVPGVVLPNAVATGTSEVEITE